MVVVLPDLVLLSVHDDFVSFDGRAIFAPADLRQRVGLHLHFQLNVLLQPGPNVLIHGRM